MKISSTTIEYRIIDKDDHRLTININYYYTSTTKIIFQRDGSRRCRNDDDIWHDWAAADHSPPTTSDSASSSFQNDALIGWYLDMCSSYIVYCYNKQQLSKSESSITNSFRIQLKTSNEETSTTDANADNDDDDLRHKFMKSIIVVANEKM